MPAEAQLPTYKVLTGISYPPNRRAEIGDVVTDIPARSIKWLLESGVIEIADERGKTKTNTAVPVIQLATVDSDDNETVVETAGDDEEDN